MFASRYKKVIQLPHESGTEITIRMMSHEERDEARQAKIDQSLDTMRKLGGVALPDSLSDEDKEKARAELAKDPSNEFKRSDVLRFGILAWNYKGDGETPDACGNIHPADQGIPCDAKHIADLDPTTADYVFREIVAMSNYQADEGEG